MSCPPFSLGTAATRVGAAAAPRCCADGHRLPAINTEAPAAAITTEARFIWPPSLFSFARAPRGRRPSRLRRGPSRRRQYRGAPLPRTAASTLRRTVRRAPCPSARRPASSTGWRGQSHQRPPITGLATTLDGERLAARFLAERQQEQSKHECRRGDRDRN